jgi:hypothetical protein
MVTTLPHSPTSHRGGRESASHACQQIHKRIDHQEMARMSKGKRKVKRLWSMRCRSYADPREGCLMSIITRPQSTSRRLTRCPAYPCRLPYPYPSTLSCIPHRCQRPCQLLHRMSTYSLASHWPSSRYAHLKKSFYASACTGVARFPRYGSRSQGRRRRRYRGFPAAEDDTTKVKVTGEFLR